MDPASWTGRTGGCISQALFSGIAVATGQTRTQSQLWESQDHYTRRVLVLYDGVFFSSSFFALKNLVDAGISCMNTAKGQNAVAESIQFAVNYTDLPAPNAKRLWLTAHCNHQAISPAAQCLEQVLVHHWSLQRISSLTASNPVSPRPLLKSPGSHYFR